MFSFFWGYNCVNLPQLHIHFTKILLFYAVCVVAFKHLQAILHHVYVSFGIVLKGVNFLRIFYKICRRFCDDLRKIFDRFE